MVKLAGRAAFVALVTVVVGSAPARAQIKSSGTPDEPDHLRVLQLKNLLFPVPGIELPRLRDTFMESRSSQRRHNAIDIPAPRGTPVLATDSGQILKLYTSKLGGLMVYAADPTEKFIYYYAHLDRYRPGLQAGMRIARGDTIGFVGTTGNAPPNTPHLHFAILASTDIRRWSKGKPINPFVVFRPE